MILAAVACFAAGAAGYSYVFTNSNNNLNEQSSHTKRETVTASSTIVDKHGIMKYVQYPRIRNPYSFMHYPVANRQDNVVALLINRSCLNQFKLPIDNTKIPIDNRNFKRAISIVFFWSIPLRAQLLKKPTQRSFTVDNSNKYERYLVKISVGIQNELHNSIDTTRIPSELALSYVDQYSYGDHRQKEPFRLNNENINDRVNAQHCNNTINHCRTPMCMLQKTKIDTDECKHKQKRFCLDTKLDAKQEKMIRNIIFNNVNLCMENLSQVLKESCTGNQTNTSALQSSLITINDSKSVASLPFKENQLKTIHAPEQQLFKSNESVTNAHYHFNNGSIQNRYQMQQYDADGLILHRGKNFGLTLGEPVQRLSKRNASSSSFHSINKLDRLFSNRSCLLMQQYNIDSVEDLIRLFLERGQIYFRDLLMNTCHVEPSIVEEVDSILTYWTKNLTWK